MEDKQLELASLKEAVPNPEDTDSGNEVDTDTFNDSSHHPSIFFDSMETKTDLDFSPAEFFAKRRENETLWDGRRYISSSTSTFASDSHLQVDLERVDKPLLSLATPSSGKYVTKTLNLRGEAAILLFQQLHQEGKLLDMSSKCQDDEGDEGDEGVDVVVGIPPLLTFSIDKSYGLYTVTLHGCCDTIDKYYEHLCTILDRVHRADCHISSELQQWEMEHVLALREKPLLTTIQKKSQAVAIFHYLPPKVVGVDEASSLASAVFAQIPSSTREQDSTTPPSVVSVEVTSLRPEGSQALLRTLQAFILRKTKWQLPEHISCDECTWPNDAVYTKVLQRGTVQVWGFDSSPEFALHSLLSASQQTKLERNPHLVRPQALYAHQVSNSSQHNAVDEDVLSQLTLEIPDSRAESPLDSDYSSPITIPSIGRLHASYKDVLSPEVKSTASYLRTTHAKFPTALGETSTSAFHKVPQKSSEAAAAHSTALPPSEPTAKHINSELIKLKPLEKRTALIEILPYKMSHAFQDREAGIYYQAFEADFAKALNQAFGVYLTPIDVRPSDNCGNSSSNSSSSSDRIRALRVEVFALRGKSCQKALSYLSRCLCATHLERSIIYFPKATNKMYKLLMKTKDIVDHACQALRMQHSAEKAQNPMETLGFVNIRLKPSPSRGSRKMNLPCDASVTVCGPVATQLQREHLKRCIDAFEKLPDEYHVAKIVISSQSSLARHVTVRTLREQFIKEYGLIGLRLNENAKGENSNSTGAPSGLAGTLKIWSPTAEKLNCVLKALEEAERAASAQQSVNGVTTHTKIATSGETQFERMNRPWSPDAPEPLTSLLADTVLHSLAHLNSSNGSINSGCSISTVDPPPRYVIHWPHPSVRFMFLEENLKNSLAELVTSYREAGVKITSPYRDKKDATSAMLIEPGSDEVGSRPLVEHAKLAVCEYMERVRSQMRPIAVTMPTKLLQKLYSSELNQLKKLQGIYGVHIVLEPDKDDLLECSYHIDLTNYSPKQVSNAKSSSSDNGQFHNIDAGEGGFVNSILGELLQMHIHGKFNTVKVQVVQNEVSNWSVYKQPALLLILDDDANLDDTDKLQLAAGKVLVHQEGNQCMVRARPQATLSEGYQSQARALRNCIKAGLLACERLHLSGVVVIAVETSSLLSCMSCQDIKVETSNAILHFAKEIARVVNTIVCLEDKSITPMSDNSQLYIAEAMMSATEKNTLLNEGSTDEMSLKVDVSSVTSLTPVQFTNMPQSHSLHSSQRPITFADMVRVKGCNKSTFPRNVAVLKGLPNNTLNTINAFWEMCCAASTTASLHHHAHVD